MDRPTMQTDPSGVVGTIGAAVGAVLALLVAFGVDLTAEQTETILGVVATVGPIVIAILIRRHAWAPASHNAQVELVRNLASRRDPPPRFVEDRMGEEPTR